MIFRGIVIRGGGLQPHSALQETFDTQPSNLVRACDSSRRSYPSGRHAGAAGRDHPARIQGRGASRQGSRSSKMTKKAT